MFNPINTSARGAHKEHDDDALNAYLAALPTENGVANLDTLLTQQKVTEASEKMMFNAILARGVDGLDIRKSGEVLARSKRVYFLIVEKLVDAGKIILARKMMNYAREKDVLPNKYFFLKKELQARKKKYLGST